MNSHVRAGYHSTRDLGGVENHQGAWGDDCPINDSQSRGFHPSASYSPDRSGPMVLCGDVRLAPARCATQVTRWNDHQMKFMYKDAQKTPRADL
jgi:hypothetical protein